MLIADNFECRTIKGGREGVVVPQRVRRTPFYIPRYNKDCECNCSIRADHTWRQREANGLVPSWFYVIYIRTYVHMCILLSEKHGRERIAGRATSGLRGSRWRAVVRRERVCYLYKIRISSERERDILYIYI